jgi:transcription antitermination factor NusG
MQQSVTDVGMPRSKEWYALVVRPNWAFKVRDRLNQIGIEQWVPTFIETVRWSDRTKTVERQLFPGYLFVRATAGEIPTVLELTGVTEILPSAMRPIAITDEEITNLRAAIASQPTGVRGPYVAGTRVSIESGPLSGASGIVVEAARQKVRVLVEMLGRPVKVAIEPAYLKKAA